jgi:hypothetical protein
LRGWRVAPVLLGAAMTLLPTLAQAAAPEGVLDGRGWEMVSPVEKNGGEVSPPGEEGAGVMQAAAAGGAIAYASATSFGEAEGAAPFSQYLATRGVGGWQTRNLTPPLLSGTYGGGAYQLFSADLSRAILSNGWRCRDGGDACEAENPPLALGAPPGYRNLYLRDLASGAYTPLITAANSPALALAPQDFHLSLVGASPDLSRVLISTCAALSVGSSEVPDGKGGCDPASPNLYEWSEGALAEAEPDEWEAEFDPGTEVQGVLGASTDRSYVYYVNSAGLWLWHAGANTKVAAGADPSNYPAATGTARVTPDGTRLAFLSSASLTGYASNGKSEVFLYEAPAKHLRCLSCRPSGNTPSGPSSIPAALAAGEGGTPLYKPRALSADGSRVFFDSADAVLPTDTDGHPDVYEWEAQGSGGCAKVGGCLGLISSGRSGEASFLDASADGGDAFFLTDASPAPADPGGLDVYDARAGGGFAEPPPQVLCEGDECQGPPPAPEDTAPGSAIEGRPNPPVRFAKRHHRRKRHRGGPHHHHRGSHRHRGGGR